MKNTSNIATMTKGREAFRQFLENEKNPIKQKKLQDYIPYIEKAYDLKELSWYFQKALEDASAQQAFLDYQNTRQVVKQKELKIWKRRLTVLWILLVIAGGFTIWKGFEPIYVYKMADGTEVPSDTYEGAQIPVHGESIPLRYSHQKMDYSNLPFMRTLGVFIGVIFLGLWTHVKLQ